MRAFRAAARASLAFVGIGRSGELDPTGGLLSNLTDGFYDGSVVHAGHLELTLTAGGGANGRGAANGATSVERYCVLLSSRVLLLLEPGVGTFEPLSGEAVQAHVLALDDSGVHVRFVHPPGTQPPHRPPPTTFELAAGGHAWLVAPGKYTEVDLAARTRVVRTWVRWLCAVIAPDGGTRGSRASLGRQSRASVGRSSLRRSSLGRFSLGRRARASKAGGGDGGSTVVGGHWRDAESAMDDELDGDRPQQCHMAGQWKGGCFYRGDGSVGYYQAPCADDPYA